ncbi:PrpF domain-containing protein [Actinoplanes sp. CA-252034]|uniref:PrpF domain-containing protein n=1 Tax=Actinoplanes sp. CA-252034 TaxID=3239906 RepID=UPI003D95DD8D
MWADMARAAGSPSATLVLGFGRLPDPGVTATPALTALRYAALDAGLGDVSKIALIGPSQRPGCDLDYRFVQVLAGDEPRFELRGSCGHSILAACCVARRRGWTTADTVRVNVLNNGDLMTCRLTGESAGEQIWDVAVEQPPHTVVTDLLLTPDPQIRLRHSGRAVRASLVSAGNPYVFVPAADIGVTDPRRLLALDEPLFAGMSALREQAEALLGWPAGGAFPKIAALLPAGPGAVAVRAVSVPRWHPTMAVTGALCLAAAVNIPGTTSHLAAGADPAGYPSVTIHTAGGRRVATADVDRASGALRSVGIRHSRVRALPPVPLPLPAPADAVSGAYR